MRVNNSDKQAVFIIPQSYAYDLEPTFYTYSEQVCMYHTDVIEATFHTVITTQLLNFMFIKVETHISRPQNMFWGFVQNIAQ